MRFLLVMAPHEQNFSALLERTIKGRRMNGEAVPVGTVEEAQQLLRDPEQRFDQVIFGTMGQQWKEVDALAAERGFGRNLITTARFGQREREEIVKTGVSIIDKDGFDRDAFISRFSPEGRQQERI